MDLSSSQSALMAILTAEVTDLRAAIHNCPFFYYKNVDVRVCVRAPIIRWSFLHTFRNGGAGWLQLGRPVSFPL